VSVLNLTNYSESLYESPDLPIEARNSAALLTSKVYYYLEEYDEALSFALGAGTAFQQDSNIPGDDEYIETLICEPFPNRCRLFVKMLLVQPRPLTDTLKLGRKISQALRQKLIPVFRISLKTSFRGASKTVNISRWVSIGCRGSPTT
jgi:hypothetical protein